jgi:hypothetical protein
MSILIRVFFTLLAMIAFSTASFGAVFGLISNTKSAMMMGVMIVCIIAAMMEAKSASKY